VIRVLIVDDQDLIRAGLRGILRRELGFEVVGECADGAEVGEAVQTTRPHVVLMDARMPGVDGMTATRRLRAASAAPPVLALTTFDDDDILAGMLRAGAAGFVLKGTNAEDLHKAVRAVANGDAWLDPSITSRVLATYRGRAVPSAPAAPPDKVLGVLTAKELQVLALVGRGRTNAEISAEMHVAEGTVKTHVNHIFAKLHLRDRPAAVIFAFEHGLVEFGDRPPAR
jgi:DNA-binding NarL/FixJ family response regulator